MILNLPNIKPHRRYDIIIITMSRWDGVYSSAIFSLAKELAKTNRVFYIDHPFTLKDFVQERHTEAVKSRQNALLLGKNYYKQISGLPPKFVAVTPRLMLPINWMADGKAYYTLANINDKILFSTVRKLIADFNIKNYVFFNSFNPFYARSFPADIQPNLTIYQSRDDISQESYIARHGIRLEKEAIANADIGMATSRELTKNLTIGSKQVQYLPNAADTDLFKQAYTQALPVPIELQGETRPIIGYFGNISPLRIDFELLRKIVKAHPQKLLLLIGTKKHEDSFLELANNVLFVGPKKLKQLPAYLQQMDCALIPFQCNTLTKSIYPLKINEYLAAGKPVVSTRFSEDIADFEDVAYLENDHERFVTAIGKAIAENDQHKINQRIKKAEQNSWKQRVNRFWEIIEDYSNHQVKSERAIGN